MRTSNEIRLHNFFLLLKECGEGRGAATKLSELTGVPQGLISQIANRVPMKSGIPRGIGSLTARKLEEGLGKDVGWMDRDHTMASTVNEADLLDLFRLLEQSQQANLLDNAKQLAEFNKIKAKLPPQAGDAPEGMDR